MGPLQGTDATSNLITLLVSPTYLYTAKIVSISDLAHLYWVFDITRLRCYQYSSSSCPNPARAPVSRSHASYQGEEIRAEAPSLRAINFNLKKKKESLPKIDCSAIVPLLSLCCSEPQQSPKSNSTIVASEALQVVPAILPRTIRLCVGNEHRRPRASPTEPTTRCIEPVSS